MEESWHARAVMNPGSTAAHRHTPYTDGGGSLNAYNVAMESFRAVCVCVCVCVFVRVRVRVRVSPSVWVCVCVHASAFGSLCVRICVCL